MKAVIIGGGVTGLALAYRLLGQRQHVTIVEKAPQVGGLASSVTLGNTSADRHFHFFCKTERHFLCLAERLSIKDKLVWQTISRALFFDGKSHPISTPTDLMRLAILKPPDRLRFAWNILCSRHLSSAKRLDRLTAEQWLRRRAGERVYKAVWEPLLAAKFGPYAPTVSAAWMSARHRMQQEKIAYLQGGASLLVRRLTEEISRLGGRILTGTRATGIATDKSSAAGVLTTEGQIDAETVISTVPLPILERLAPGPLAGYLKRFPPVKYLGVVTSIFLLRRPLTRYFWLNTNDPAVSSAGIIDYTNLDPNAADKPHIIYVPDYCLTQGPPFTLADEVVVAKKMEDFAKVNPDFSPDWVIGWRVVRDEFAQHVCPSGLLKRIPPHLTPLRGFFVAEWSQFYPDDRSVNNSIKLAYECAATVLNQTGR